MAGIPSFENALLHVHRSLGLEVDDDKSRKKLIRLQKPFAQHTKEVQGYLEDILSAFGMDPEAQWDAVSNIEEWGQFNTHLEINTWTHGAELRQVLWHLFGYFYAPSLGRRVAFWTLHDRLDKGMPGGSFWYLPNIHERDGQVELSLPVPQVIHWLQDLLGNSGTRGLAGTADDSDSIQRVLYNWLHENDVPRVDTIERHFSEDAKLEFRGVFLSDAQASLDDNLKAAVEFVRGKNLDADTLRHQIPMTQPGRLEAVLAGSAPEDDRKAFIALLAERYGRPSLRTIRQRLLVARMAQDGYKRLGKCLLGKNFDPACPDPSKNKVLQLVAIFRCVYNLTIQAHEQCATPAEEDIWFESRLPSWDWASIYLSILPSRREQGAGLLGEKLTRKLAVLQPGAELEDLVGWDKVSTAGIVKRDMLRLKDELEEDQEIERIGERMRTSSPWRALQSTQNWWVVTQVALDDRLPLAKRALAAKKLHELASTPHQSMGALCIELGQLHNNDDRKARPKDAKARATALLEQARRHEAFPEWRAAVLQYQAKHHLACNEFDTARECFKQAHEASHENSFGPLRGEIARDAFALAVGIPQNGFALENYEWCYRTMLAHGGFELEPGMPPAVPGLEDVAYQVEEYFWDTLYMPYPGEQPRRPALKKELQALRQEAFGIVFDGNWPAFEAWLAKHSVHDGKRADPIRGDSELMLWIRKHQNFSFIKNPAVEALLASDMRGEGIRRTLIGNMHKAVCLMARGWPKSSNLANHRKVTPAMLAAAGDDVRLLAVLLDEVKAKAGLQDHMGRTALYLAAAAASSSCVELLLARCPEAIMATTVDRQTALHAAVEACHPGIVRMLVCHSPALKSMEDAVGCTPLALAQQLRRETEELDVRRRPMQFNDRREASLKALGDIIQMLQD